MDLKLYNRIIAHCKKHLVQPLHSRHLEDSIQHVCLEHLEGNTNWNWAFLNYCRSAGLSKRAKQSAQTLEKSTFTGTVVNEEREYGDFLFDGQAIEQFKEVEKEASLFGIEDLFKTLKINKECEAWLLRNYKPNHRKINSII